MGVKILKIIDGLPEIVDRPFEVSSTEPNNTNILWVDPQNGLKYYNETEGKWLLVEGSSVVDDLSSSVAQIEQTLSSVTTKDSGGETVIKGSSVDMSTASVSADILTQGTGDVQIQSNAGNGTAISLYSSYIKLTGGAFVLDPSMYGTIAPSGTAKEGQIYLQVVS